MKPEAESLSVASPTRKPIQFRLRTLLIVVSLFCGMFAYFGHWNQLRMRADALRKEFDELFRSSIVVKRPVEVIEASRALCLAQCTVPFADSNDACREHLDNVQVAGLVYLLESKSLPVSVREEQTEKIYAREFEAKKWVACGVASQQASTTKANSE
ncbi:MAG TPA: hypothetical protein VG056_08420 [Pirellulales bacterium]|nr:hypothetical protein [Pirellulales bacterium]